ncbi:MoaD/ThiS family protein [Defluviimonas sp. SAOS-178_SWC]|uniref:MoaD/ThiS family protein n=1 Tax=Defluviimonas sp. SAOS-178_SWC TaxID=3121287 RepID=UPI0032217EFC
MPVIRFTANLMRHRPVPRVEAEAVSVREALEAAWAEDPLLRSYILDEQGRLRRHVNIFVDGEMIADRLRLSDPVGARSEIYVLQALSGG